MDIEDLKEMGLKKNICPYYYSTMAKDFADIIFLPYNYLLSPNNVPLDSTPLKNSVIIFDEAHNILEKSEEGSSFKIESEHLEQALEELNVIKESSYQNIKIVRDYIN